MEEEVGPIITKQEMAMFQEIDKDDRKLFKELFWMRRDYDPWHAGQRVPRRFRTAHQSGERQFQVSRPEGLAIRHGEGLSADGLARRAASEVAPPARVVCQKFLARQRTRTRTRDPRPRASPAPVAVVARVTPTVWVYHPKPSLGIPDGLAVEFRRREPFGYRVANMDDIEEYLERAKERMVANRAIGYALDDNGRLRKPDDKFDPNSPAKTVLSALRNTGETSSAIAFTTTPSFFQASDGEIYVPIDFAISEGPTSDNLTFFYTVEDADGFERNQAEEPVQLTKDAAGRWRYEYPIQLAPGLYTLYVGFLDTAANVHGTQIIDLQVPSFEGDALALSSVVMFSTMDKTDEVNGAPGKAFLLASHHFKPKGERVYNHSEVLSGILYAYNYGLAGEQPNLTLQVSIFKDGEKRAQMKDTPFGAQASHMALTIFDIPLNISRFKEPGDYTIEITVTDHIKNENLTEKIAFVIEE